MCSNENIQSPVKQRPILFSTDMVRAILEGRKTMTRRTLKAEVDARGLRWCNPHTGWEDWHGNPVRCPYGQEGDILWVREEHSRYGHWEPVPGVKTPTGRQKWAFVPDTKEVRYFDAPPADYRKGMHNADPETPAWHKRLARFMPKDACRLFLKNTGTRFERLQDISQEDAQAEGVWPAPHRCPGWKTNGNEFKDCYRCVFKVLWNKINGPAGHGWDKNEWVWVVSFEMVSKP